MRFETALFVVSLTLSPAVPAQEQPSTGPPPEMSERCSAEKRPKMFCEVHQVSFEAVEAMPTQRLPVEAANLFGVGTLEYRCRYKRAHENLFPNTTPMNLYLALPVACAVGYQEPRYRCECVQCGSAEREWRKAYKGRDDVTPLHREARQGQDMTVFTELLLRIQELRASGEIEVAECLQGTWEQAFVLRD